MEMKQFAWFLFYAVLSLVVYGSLSEPTTPNYCLPIYRNHFPLMGCSNALDLVRCGTSSEYFKQRSTELGGAGIKATLYLLPHAGTKIVPVYVYLR